MARPPADTTLPREEGKPKAGEPVRAQLRAVYPVGLDWSVELGSGRTVIGREPDAEEARLDHPTVSRQHLSVEWDAAARANLARDLGSRNGSFADGLEIASAARPLRDHSVL